MSSNLSTPPFVSAIKGLALASSFISLGSLYTLSSATIPGILTTLTQDSSSAAQTAAKQFAIAQRAGQKSILPSEILAILSFGFLSYNSYTNASRLTFGRTGGAGKWQIYLLASLSMFTVIPITATLLVSIESKLLALADAPTHVPSSVPALEHSSRENFSLKVPGQSSTVRPAITPVEDFEPYEDSPFSAEEYEMEKVRRMLGKWNSGNLVRRVGVALAGVLGLWAALD